MDNNLSGKVAVITGGGGVLCSFFAKVLAARGASVAILDIKLPAASKAAEEINASGGRAVAVQVNVLDKDSLIAAREEVRAALGVCDILVNGAGGNHPGGTTTKEYFDECDAEKKDDITRFFDLSKEGLQFVFDLNCMGTLLTTQVFAEDLVKSKDACVINISSMNSYRPLTKIPAYSAAKAAVSNMTMWLAVHFSRVGLRVNAIAPGFFVTDQNRGLLFDKEGNPTPRSEKILAHTPMGRFGDPSDLEGTLLWLADSKTSGFVTGIVVPVDGGFSAYSGV
ncbi:MAG: SDR family oxidoreductase [Eubacteriales bacterium]